MQTNRFMLFHNGNVYKSVFTILSLLSILALSLVILFDIDSFPLSRKSWNTTLHKAFILFIVWNGGVVINKNLHISKHGDFPSYFMALFLNSFLISLVAFRLNYLPADIYTTVNENVYYYLGLVGFNILWKMILYFYEKNTRPYFAKYLFWVTISLLMTVIVINVGEWNFDRYYLQGIKYNRLEAANIAIILTMPVVFLILFISSYMGGNRILKYSSEERSSMREIVLWNSFSRITSLAIWAIWSIQVKISNFNLYDKIGAIIAIFIYLVSILAIIISLIRRQSRFIVYVFTTNLIIMSTVGFIFVNILNSTPSDTFLFFIIFIVIFHFMFILIKPKTYPLYPQLNSLLSFLLVLFIFFIWSGNQIIGEINFLGINEIIWGSMLTISLLMFGLQIFSELFTSSRLNRRFSKIIKQTKMEMKLQRAKEVANV